MGDHNLSFNLQTHEWITPPNYYDDDSDYYDHDSSSSDPLTFLHYKPVSVVNDMAFGFRHKSSGHDLEGNCICVSKYVCASHTISGGEELMQASLAPDQDFLEVLRSSRFAYIHKGEGEYFDDWLVALQDVDGKQVLCIVTYGSDGTYRPISDRSAYVALSFFDIPGDFYTLKDSRVQECDVELDARLYADQKDEDGDVVRRYFSAKHRHTTHFSVNTSHRLPCGKIVACFP
ncbi:hypothetical protein POM88_015187 [Heracleum sosnowskyi]|uniref:Uncharacterized protein n=1 Tax=Heracleum sosnowskyi TaxID=360622 RepID=A0AAD8IJE5_9APIA|nr:hypothetical protein POM88_015187 [Heracleum sosnowskyi]